MKKQVSKIFGWIMTIGLIIFLFAGLVFQSIISSIPRVAIFAILAIYILVMALLLSVSKREKKW